MLFGSKKTKSGVDWIVAGLGNPGKKYDGTRHNCGYMAVDYIADRLGVRITRSRFSALCRDVRLGGASVLLLKPTTYMNLSGIALSEASSYYGVAPDRIIVIHDDIAIPCGTIRIKKNGSAGGHNGIKSIIESLGSENFSRVKIGIGEQNRGEMREHVLSRPAAAQLAKITERFADVERAVQLIVEGETETAQGLFNRIGRERENASD